MRSDSRASGERGAVVSSSPVSAAAALGEAGAVGSVVVVGIMGCFRRVVSVSSRLVSCRMDVVYAMKEGGGAGSEETVDRSCNYIQREGG